MLRWKNMFGEDHYNTNNNTASVRKTGDSTPRCLSYSLVRGLLGSFTGFSLLVCLGTLVAAVSIKLRSHSRSQSKKGLLTYAGWTR